MNNKRITTLCLASSLFFTSAYIWSSNYPSGRGDHLKLQVQRKQSILNY